MNCKRDYTELYAIVEGVAFQDKVAPKLDLRCLAYDGSDEELLGSAPHCLDS